MITNNLLNLNDFTIALKDQCEHLAKDCTFIFAYRAIARSLFQRERCKKRNLRHVSRLTSFLNEVFFLLHKLKKKLDKDYLALDVFLTNFSKGLSKGY